MNKWLWILAGWLATGSPLQAQVTVEITQRQTDYLPREAIILGVRITNLAGRTIALGKDANWLHFLVERKSKGFLSRTDDMPLKGLFQIESSKVATRYVNLAPFYDITIPGRYRVSAVVTIDELGLQVTSTPKDFDIVRGISLWEQGFGVPNSAGITNTPPEFRKYILQQTANLQQMRLYVCLTDSVENRIFRVSFLGPMVSFSRPEAQLDAASNLYVLWQTGARIFQFTQVGTEGRVKLRQTYTHTNSRPTLKKDADGKIRVIGGIRRVSEEDLPSPDQDEAPTNSIPTPP